MGYLSTTSSTFLSFRRSLLSPSVAAMAIVTAFWSTNCWFESSTRRFRWSSRDWASSPNGGAWSRSYIETGLFITMQLSKDHALNSTHKKDRPQQSIVLYLYYNFFMISAINALTWQPLLVGVPVILSGEGTWAALGPVRLYFSLFKRTSSVCSSFLLALLNLSRKLFHQVSFEEKTLFGLQLGLQISFYISCYLLIFS